MFLFIGFTIKLSLTNTNGNYICLPNSTTDLLSLKLILTLCTRYSKDGDMGGGGDGVGIGVGELNGLTLLSVIIYGRP